MSRLFIFVSLFILSSFAFSHGDDEIPFVEFTRIMSELASDIEHYQSSPDEIFSKAKNIYTIIDKNGKRYKITQSTISKVFAYHLALNKELFDFHCSGGCHTHKRQTQIYLSKLFKKIISGEKKVINLSNLDKVMESLVTEAAVNTYKLARFPIKFTYEFVTEDLPHFFWKSVSKARSLGAVFVLINGIGEGLDIAFIHSLHIPIPLCKVINAASFWLAEKWKMFSNIALKKQDGRYSFVNKWKTFKNINEFKKSRLAIRKEAMKILYPPKRDISLESHRLKKQWKKFRNFLDRYKKNVWEKSSEKVFADFTNFAKEEMNIADDFKVFNEFNEAIIEFGSHAHFVNLKRNREVVNKVFLDQFDTIQNWISLTSEFYLESYEESELSFRDHLRVQWRLGEIESEFIKYKASILNILSNPTKKKMTPSEINELYNRYEGIVRRLAQSSDIDKTLNQMSKNKMKPKKNCNHFFGWVKF